MSTKQQEMDELRAAFNHELQMYNPIARNAKTMMMHGELTEEECYLMTAVELARANEILKKQVVYLLERSALTMKQIEELNNL